MALNEADTLSREHLVELLRGGFAPVVILLREFHYNKIAVVLDGLPFSTWSLLEHMRTRQRQLLLLMKNENKTPWPEAYWPENPAPENEETWNKAIGSFEADLDEVIRIIKDTTNPLSTPLAGGKTLLWAVIAVLQHNAYHIGQIKAIGRQLGVW